ncbi:MAG TPA: HAMP domain-containing sensor histidine kinase, partial [Nitrospira sp.]|nr:HAMP domain-containing sensor histidine kinase [Nitrospira sp.]
GIAIGPAALLLSPVSATLVGMSIGIATWKRGWWPLVGNAVLGGTYACVGAVVALQLRSSNDLSFPDRLVVLTSVNVAVWILVGVGLALRTGESIASVARRTFTAQFFIAFAYFALASLLASYVLDGSFRGYLLATIVFVLALALTDTIAGRRIRRVLELELSDADRHLFHSRAVEGVVHNLRNHMATAVGYLKEIDTNRLDPIDREAVQTARLAANDAVTVLQSLSQGATPRVTYAQDPVDLNELVTRAQDMARPRARSKRVEIAVRESPEDVKVRADPLLMREVITNLVNNAIDAAPDNGRVELLTGRRANGSPFFTVTDNGTGVAEENRHHLFEPHFTTKEHGTGLGLFMSYGIVREHQGRLEYEGSQRGAIFTVTFPPYR